MEKCIKTQKFSHNNGNLKKNQNKILHSGPNPCNPTTGPAAGYHISKIFQIHLRSKSNLRSSVLLELKRSRLRYI